MDKQIKRLFDAGRFASCTELCLKRERLSETDRDAEKYAYLGMASIFLNPANACKFSSAPKNDSTGQKIRGTITASAPPYMALCGAPKSIAGQLKLFCNPVSISISPIKELVVGGRHYCISKEIVAVMEVLSGKTLAELIARQAPDRPAPIGSKSIAAPVPAG